MVHFLLLACVHVKNVLSKRNELIILIRIGNHMPINHRKVQLKPAQILKSGVLWS